MLKTFLILPLLFIGSCVSAQVFRATVSVLGNLNSGPYHFTQKEGDFKTEHSSFNLGVGIGVACYPFENRNWYVSSGIRLNTTEGGIIPRNTDPDFSLTNGDFWNYHWQALTIPLYIGRTIAPFKGSNFYVDAYAGASFGIIFTSMMRSTTWQGNGAGQLVLGVGRSQPLVTLDAGFRFNPFTRLPNLSVGFLFAYNIQTSNDIQGLGYFASENGGVQKDYNFDVSRRFNNYTFSINYSFGSRWKNAVVGKVRAPHNKNKLACPE